MAISAKKAMRRLCELKGWSISNLEANKLLYFAQMVALGERKQPLVNGSFEAWDLGPVHPDAYHKAKVFGAKPIRPYIFKSRGIIPEWEGVFARTLDSFGKLTSGQLVAESHWEDGAWARHYRPGAKGVEIPNGDIATEYRSRTN